MFFQFATKKQSPATRLSNEGKDDDEASTDENETLPISDSMLPNVSVVITLLVELSNEVVNPVETLLLWLYTLSIFFR